MRTQVGYISAIPSLGKTHWAIEQMIANLKASGCSLYVAPTVRLLDEVYEKLKKKLPKKTFERVFNLNFETCDPDIGVGKTIRTRLRKADPKGLIVLVTHDSFLKLRRMDAFAQFDLYFDEARKVVMRGGKVDLTDLRSQQLFSKLFKFEPRPSGSEFRQVTCKPNAERILRRHRNFANDADLVEQFKHIRKLLKNASDERMEVFLRVPIEADPLIAEGDTYLMKNHKFYEIVLPSRIFEGFKSVSVLAAHFEESQMYHLLNEAKQRVDLVPIRAPGIDVRSRRYAELVGRYSSVTIVPLTNQYKALSLHKLTDSLLAPLNRRQEIMDSLKTRGVSWVRKAMRAQKQSTSNKLTSVQSKDMKYLKTIQEIQFDPLRWHIDAFRSIVCDWAQHHDVKGLPLVIMNNRFTQKKTSGYVQQLRNKKGRPWAEVLPFMNHGLNEFDKQNVLGFLAAINPDSAMIRFYQERLPDYNFEEDHVADVCVQSACRLSVRDPSSPDEILIVVPDQEIARLLNKKLFERGVVDTRYAKRLGDLVALNNDFDNYMSPKEARFARAEAEERHRIANAKQMTEARRTSPYSKRLQSIANMIAQNKKKGDTARVTALEAERTELKRLKAKFPDKDENVLVEKAKRKSK